MDRSQTDFPNRAIKSSTDGGKGILDFAFKNVVGDTRIYCPSKECRNRYLAKEVKRDHIIINNFWSKYKNWILHGEPSSSLESNQQTEVNYDSSIDDDMVGMIHDVMGTPINYHPPEHEGLKNETKEFFKLLQEVVFFISGM